MGYVGELGHMWVDGVSCGFAVYEWRAMCGEENAWMLTERGTVYAPLD